MERTRPAAQDLWAYCGVCAKWFYVARSVDADRGALCPVCDVPSATFRSVDEGGKHCVARSKTT